MVLGLLDSDSVNEPQTQDGTKEPVSNTTALEMADGDEVDSEFVRVSFSSRGSRSVTIERSANARRKGSAISSDWKPARQRFLLRKLNASIYNCLAKLRLLFSPCCCRSLALDDGADLVLLGQRYTQSDSTADLFQDIYSRLYFSYRTGFVPLRHSRVEIRSDTGWGCTIRTAQMLAAEGLVRHLLGRNYRRVQETAGLEHIVVEGIVRLFHDEPSIHCPLSIHNMTSIAFREFGQKPGQWYNPSMVGHVLHKAVRQHQALGDQAAPQLNDLCVYVARDGCIFVEDLFELCMPSDPNVKWRSPLILVALRLGIESVRPGYHECLKKVLENRYTIGVVGGRENSSFFFIGYQKDQLFYLDPHYLRSCGDQEAEHYFAKEVRRMRFKNLRPSCLLGFYCRNQDELGEFLSSVQDDVSAIEMETGRLFQLVEVCSGSASSLDSNKLVSRKSVGSLEILSLFEQRGLLCSDVTVTRTTET